MTAAELLGALLALDADTLRETEVCISYGGGFPVRSVFIDDGTLWISDGDPEPETIELYPDDGQCAQRERQAADALKALVGAAKCAEASFGSLARQAREQRFWGTEELCNKQVTQLRGAIAKVEGGS